VGCLVESSLASDQKYVFERQVTATSSEVTFNNADQFLIALKDHSYSYIYDILAGERAYIVMLPDGGLIQMQYLFEGGDLDRHRLAIFPSPYLEEFQNNPEIYLDDDVFADVVAKNIVPFPIRFDFDSRKGVWKELEHAQSHLSLAQYQNCRIPVSSPVGPSSFIEFILRNFYNSAFYRCADGLPMVIPSFNDSMLPSEEGVLHVRTPSQ